MASQDELIVVVTCVVEGEQGTSVRRAVELTARASTFAQLARIVQAKAGYAPGARANVATHVLGFYPDATGGCASDTDITAHVKTLVTRSFSGQVLGEHASVVAVIAWVVETPTDHVLYHHDAPNAAKLLDVFLGPSIAKLETLPVPTRSMKASKLFIRGAYDQLAERIIRGKDSAFVVTGTPGVGTTTFLWYLLRLLHLDSKFVVFDCDNLFLLVRPDGSVLRGTRGASFRRFLDDPTTFYLCDDREPLVGADVAAKTVLTMSPDASMIEHFVKVVCPAMLFMPLWSLEELEKCRSLCHGTIEASTVRALHARFGGTARDTLIQTDGLSTKLAEFMHSMDCLTATTIAANFDFIGEGGAIYATDNQVCHQLLHLQVPRAKSGKYAFDRVAFVPASIYACREILKQHRAEMTRIIHVLLSRPACMPQLAETCRMLFETLVHAAFATGGDFDTRSLDESESTGALTVAAETVVFDEVAETQTRQYAIPRALNFAAVDAVMKPNRLFQISVGDDHPIHRQDLDHILEKLMEDENSARAKAGKTPLTMVEMEFELYFVVPNDKFDKFKQQRYRKNQCKKSESPHTTKPLPIKQYALCINLADTLNADPTRSEESVPAPSCAHGKEEVSASSSSSGSDLASSAGSSGYK